MRPEFFIILGFFTSNTGGDYIVPNGCVTGWVSNSTSLRVKNGHISAGRWYFNEAMEFYILEVWKLCSC